MRLTSLIALPIALSVACGPTKPDASRYVGQWSVRTPNFGQPPSAWYDCDIELTRFGEGVAMKLDGASHGDVCREYDGVMLSLTPEGELKSEQRLGVPPITVIVDTTNGEVAMHTRRGGIQQLREQGHQFVGRWRVHAVDSKPIVDTRTGFVTGRWTEIEQSTPLEWTMMIERERPAFRISGGGRELLMRYDGGRLVADRPDGLPATVTAIDENALRWDLPDDLLILRRRP